MDFFNKAINPVCLLFEPPHLPITFSVETVWPELLDIFCLMDRKIIVFIVVAAIVGTLITAAVITFGVYDG